MSDEKNVNKRAFYRKAAYFLLAFLADTFNCPVFSESTNKPKNNSF